MFKILRGKCQPANDENIFMELIGLYKLRSVAKLSKAFRVECEGVNLKKIEFWWWEGRGQNPHSKQNGATQEMRGRI